MDNNIDKSVEDSHEKNTTKKHSNKKWIFAGIVLLLLVIWLREGDSILSQLIDNHSYSETELPQENDDYSYFEINQNPWYIDRSEYNYSVIRGYNDVTIIDSIEWIMEDGDMYPFCRKGVKGYFNTKNSNNEIPAKYEYVWIFREGKAAVVKDGRMFFINDKDSIVLSGNWEYVQGYDFIFRDGYCIVCVNDKLGLIDSLGHYVLDPKFIDIYRKQDGFYTVDEDHSLSYYNLKGELIRTNCISSVSEILVTKNVMEYNKYNVSLDNKSIQSNCLKYEGEKGWYGLMNLNGKILTRPIYKKIYSITPDLFYCEGKLTPNTGQIVNSQGKILGQ